MNTPVTPGFVAAENDKQAPSSTTAPQHQFHDLPKTYCHAWQDKDPQHLLSLFADDAVMTDHGAQIQVPRDFLERHHQHWNGAHADFEVYLEYV